MSSVPHKRTLYLISVNSLKSQVNHRSIDHFPRQVQTGLHKYWVRIKYKMLPPALKTSPLTPLRGYSLPSIYQDCLAFRLSYICIPVQTPTNACHDRLWHPEFICLFRWPRFSLLHIYVCMFIFTFPMWQIYVWLPWQRHDFLNIFRKQSCFFYLHSLMQF